jgi:hypothetical protein
MADVMERFMRGRAGAQAEQEHAQALEDSKLRQKILKHEIDNLKINDELRGREVQRQNLEMMTGTPAADLPQEAMPHAPNEPPTEQGVQPEGGLAGMVRSMMGGPMEQRQGAEGLQPVPMTRAAAMPIGGVPEWNIPGVSARPRSLEDLVHASMVQELNKVRNVNRGSSLFLGTQKIASGEPAAETRLDLAGKAVAGDTGAAATLDRAFPPRAGAQDNFTSETVSLDGKPNSKVLKNRAGQYFTLDKQPITNASTRIGANPRQPAANNDPEAASRRNYAQFVGTYKAQNPMPTAADYLAPGADLSKPLPKPAAAPSFEKWKVMTADERQKVIRDPGNRIDDAEMAKRAKAGTGAAAASKLTADTFKAALSAQGKQLKPNTRYTMSDGSVFDVLPDGSIDGPKAK